MADFTAVIERAVNGLADNSYEMRQMIYARARGAVDRQLDSMKPRPPEDMIERQLQKLEDAIASTEVRYGSHPATAAVSISSSPTRYIAEPSAAPRFSLARCLVPYKVRADFLMNIDDQYEEIWLPKLGRVAANRRWLKECLMLAFLHRVDPLLQALKLSRRTS